MMMMLLMMTILLLPVRCRDASAVSANPRSEDLFHIGGEEIGVPRVCLPRYLDLRHECSCNHQETLQAKEAGRSLHLSRSIMSLLEKLLANYLAKQD